MKKLGIALAIVSLMLTGNALAAEKSDPGQDNQSPRASKAKRAGFKECDKDGDGLLSRAEFQACYPKRAEHFAAIDADKDGKASREELRADRDARKLERRKAFFAACDANKDGQLGFEEFNTCSDEHKAKQRKAKGEKKR